MLRFVKETDLQRIERLKKAVSDYLSGTTKEIMLSDEDLKFMVEKAYEQVRFEVTDGETDDDDILPIPEAFKQQTTFDSSVKSQSGGGYK